MYFGIRTRGGCFGGWAVSLVLGFEGLCNIRAACPESFRLVVLGMLVGI